MNSNVKVYRDIVLSISVNYYELPRKAKKKENKRIGTQITKALECYIENLTNLQK